jgi:hypothetical protein
MPDQFSGYAIQEDFLPIGRTFEEYRRLFDLDPPALAGSRVLDCAAGPSAFTAVASAVGADVTAVDPMYERGVEALADTCRDAIERTEDRLVAEDHGFNWEEYGDPETRCRYLRGAAERFLADYARRPDRYHDEGLPDLPFDDGAFDLALSANLCFLYSDRLDRSFHEAAVAELARVAEEVRIFPLITLEGERSPYVEPVIDALADAGRDAAVRPVPYEFIPGGNEILVVD